MTYGYVVVSPLVVSDLNRVYARRSRRHAAAFYDRKTLATSEEVESETFAEGAEVLDFLRGVTTDLLQRFA
ncbi:hypothetical protein RR48_11043 [Papilio machaon]|uniref:Uncharacterized protein n=1 Tax=Papilio machaon TaxID=76193 RepID=A0A194RTH2_PAPMA|nr:hypothetical protein RR48_11043 [Papilio machaon]